VGEMNEYHPFSAETIDPESLEIAYHRARREGNLDSFVEAVAAHYAENPEDRLLAAWHVRLQYAAHEAQKRAIAWLWAVPLALLNGLLFWLLSDNRFVFHLPGLSYGYPPWLAVYWMPIATVFILIYLSAAGKERWRSALGIGAGVMALAVYVQGIFPHMSLAMPMEQYLNLAAIHLPILGLAAIGLYLLKGQAQVADRFALLLKMLEAMILVGIFVAVGGIFVALTNGLFAALAISLPDIVIRLLVAGGGGLIPVLATAVVYDPANPPAGQPLEEGLGKVISLLLRLMLPLTLLVLLVYLIFIPLNFRAPFTHREVLITYNATLFAVMLLLLGVTPMRDAELPRNQQRWLRRGILAAVATTASVGLYALAAIGYRTWQGGFTPNRLAFIGWNIINLVLLFYLLGKQVRTPLENWLRHLHEVFATGALAYACWALLVLVVTPWLFALPPDPAIQQLPSGVQRAIYGGRYPILLKCYGSPHIFLLEKGKKHWVKDIPTFEAEGFRWEDVRSVTCHQLRQIPDGPPIPPDAGPPPVPRSRAGPVPTVTPLPPTPTTAPP